MRILPMLLLAVIPAPAAPARAEEDVRAVLDKQVAAWNRGDLEDFVTTYSEETVFVGRELTRGNRGVLERYRRSYSTREKMGTLGFHILEVKMLGSGYASVLGRFHLARTAAGGGDADGVFTLLLKKSRGGWKIILDHTS
jgi:uncharacterized protein (TIGR02246 family)